LALIPVFSELSMFPSLVEFTDLINLMFIFICLLKKISSTNPIYFPFMGSFCSPWAKTCLS
jgi:hypothetical protein